MPAYLIAFVEVTDPVKYAEYTKLTPAAIAKFGGRFVVRGGPVTTLEGPEEKRRVVVIEFASRERADAFYQSEDYQRAKKLRIGAANGAFILVDGVVERGS
jgi:uncharacterized protein (DUF1330 family)